MEHNKRAVLAYLKYRIEHVFQLRWEMGTAAVPQELQVNTTCMPHTHARAHAHSCIFTLEHMQAYGCGFLHPWLGLQTMAPVLHFSFTFSFVLY